MKKLLFLTGIFLCLKSSAQISGWTPVFGHYEYKFIGGDSVLFTPGDTLTDAPINSLAIKGGVLYYKTSTNWSPVSGSGGGATWGVNIGGDINTQSDLINLLNLKVSKSDTGSMLAPYLRSALGVKYSDTGSMLSPYLRSALFTKSNLGLGNVTNSLQVINYGGMTNIGLGAFASIPLPGVGPLLWFASDTVAWYFNTGSSYVKASGSGSGGGSTDSSIYATRYYTGHNFYPLTGNPSSFLTTITSSQITTALGFTPYSSSNPSGFITGNQTVTITPSGDIKGKASGSTAINPADTVIGLENSALPALATGNLRYNSGWLFDNTHYYNSADTASILATKSNIAAIGTPFVHYTDSSSIYFTKYRSDTMRADLYAALALKVAYSDSGTIYQTKYRSDTSRINIYAALSTKVNYTDSNSIYYTKYRSDTSRSNIYSLLSGGVAGKVNYTDSNSIYYTKYRSDTSRANIYTAIASIGLASKVNYSDSSTIYFTKYRSDTMRADIYAALLGKVNYSDSNTTYFTKYRSDTSRVNIYNAIVTGLASKVNNSDSATKYFTKYRSDTMRANLYAAILAFDTLQFHVGIQKDGSRGINIARGFDSTLVFKGLVDSGALHIFLNPDSTVTFYVSSSGGTGTTNISIQKFANYDSVKSSTGTGAELDTADAFTGGHSGLMSNYGYIYTHTHTTIRKSLCSTCDSIAYSNADTLYLDGMTTSGTGILIKQTLDSLLFSLDSTVSIFTTQANLEAGSYASNKGIYIIDPGQEGLFIADTTDHTTASNVGTVLVSANNIRWKRKMIDNKIKVSWFKVKADGTTNNTAAFEKIWPIASGKSVELMDGRMLVDSLPVQRTDNLEVYGHGKISELYVTSSNMLIHATGDVNNWYWHDMYWNCDNVHPTFDSFDGLFECYGNHVDGVLIKNVWTRNPYTNSGVIGFIFNGVGFGGNGKHIYIDQLHSDSAGCNVVGLLNRDTLGSTALFNSNKPRYIGTVTPIESTGYDSLHDFAITNSEFTNPGLVLQDGTPVTLDGVGYDGRIANCTVNNALIRGFENTGFWHIKIDGNWFRNTRHTSYSDIGFSNRPIMYCDVTGNHDVDSMTQPTDIQLTYRSNFSGNFFKSSGKFTNCSWNTSTNDTYTDNSPSGTWALTIKSTPGNTSVGNVFIHPTIDNTMGTVSPVALLFDGKGVSQNIVKDPNFLPSATGVNMGLIDTAANTNYVFNPTIGSVVANSNFTMSLAGRSSTIILTNDSDLIDYKVYQFTGSISQNDTVSLPSRIHTNYMVHNETNHSVFMTAPYLGGNGITVPSAATFNIFTDSTSIRSDVTTFGSTVVTGSSVTLALNGGSTIAFPMAGANAGAITAAEDATLDSLKNRTITGFGGFTNPMTTLGDFLVGTTAGAAARLAGNTASTRLFMTSQGTGSAAQAPTLSALASGDIPNNAANTTGSAGSLASGAIGVTPTTGDSSTKIPTTAFVKTAVDSAHYQYVQIAAGGTPLAQETNIAFLGGLSAVDDPTHHATSVVIPSSTLGSGKTKPAVTGNTNVASITADSALWTRTASNVSVDGRFTVSLTTGSSAWSVNIPIPVASALPGLSGLFGTGVAPSTTNGSIPLVISASGTSGSQTCIIFGNPLGQTTSATIYYHYQYTIQ